MTVPTLKEKMKYYSKNEEYKECFELISDWVKLTNDEKVNYVCKHVQFTTPDRLKVWIDMKILKKQVLGIERVQTGETIITSKYDVRKYELIYPGNAVLKGTADMFVIPTDDNEKDILLIFTIKLGSI